MLKTKHGKRILGTLALCAMVGTFAASSEARADAPKSDTENGGLTINTEKGSKTLYTEVLETVGTDADVQKYVEVKRGEFLATVSASGTVVYPKKETVRYYFPYGTVYFRGTVGTESSVKKAGDVIAKIEVRMDEIELAERERQILRMEERGETGSTYNNLKSTLESMREAYAQTEIVIEEGGVLLSQDNPRNGSQITSYSIVMADMSERVIEVPNTNKQFRFGQRVTVTARVGGASRTGMGTVISASPNSVSEELAGTTAYIKLDEEYEDLYSGSNISVSVETVRMENVLLLDASAAYVENGNQMVKVKDEYGLHAVGFSFGRKSTSTYWVIDGLEEGAKILVQ